MPIYIYLFHIIKHNTHVAAHRPLLGDTLYIHLHAIHTDHSTALEQLAVIYFFLWHVNLPDLLATFEASFLLIASIIISPRHFSFTHIQAILDDSRLIDGIISLTSFHFHFSKLAHTHTYWYKPQRLAHIATFSTFLENYF